MIEKVPFPNLRSQLVNGGGYCVPPWNSFFQNLIDRLNNSNSPEEIAFLTKIYNGYKVVPITNDASIRIASGPIPFGVGSNGYSIGYLYYGGGNGLWLYDKYLNEWRVGRIQGNFGPPIDVRSCLINKVPGQTLVPDVLYWIYAFFANSGDQFLTLNFSLTSAVAGDPFGNSPVTGYSFENGTGYEMRHVGWAWTDASGFIWRAESDPGKRGVFWSGTASLYHPQILNYHKNFTGDTTTSATWVGLNANNYVGGLVQEDNGIESFLTVSGVVKVFDAAPTVRSIGVGVGRNFASNLAPTSPPYNKLEFDIMADVNPIGTPFSISVSCGDHSTSGVFYQMMAKTSGGTLTLSDVTMEMLFIG